MHSAAWPEDRPAILREQARAFYPAQAFVVTRSFLTMVSTNLRAIPFKSASAK
jgi:hypothetical protein